MPFMTVWLASVAAIALMSAVMYLFHRRLRKSLAAPREPIRQTLASHGLIGESISIPTQRGRRLAGWWLPGQQRTGVVIITHGWGANREIMLPLARPLQAAGWDVLLFDARNHGQSDTDDFSSMPRFAEDTDAAIDWVRRQAGQELAPIVLMGHSVGAAAVLLSASRRRDVAAVVSLSTFAHPDGMMRRWLTSKGIPFFPLGWYVLRYVEHVIGHRFKDIAPIHTLPQVQCPVLLVHGREDPVIPASDAQRLLASRGNTPAVLHLLDGEHDLSRHLDSEWPRLQAFLGQAIHHRNSAGSY